MTRSRHALVGILALAVLLPLIPTGRRVLWESNETRYPVLAQDILEHGRWLVPEIRGQLYLNKSQLYFWTIALVSLPAGRVSELSATLLPCCPRWRPSARCSRSGRGSGAAAPGCSRA